MKITGIKLTTEELHQAVKDWLYKQGVTVTIEEVTKHYAKDEYDVKVLDIPTESQPLAPILSDDELPIV